MILIYELFKALLIIYYLLPIIESRLINTKIQSTWLWHHEDINSLVSLCYNLKLQI